MSTTASAPADEAALPRKLGLIDATTIVVGSMIGSGIFLKASRIAQLLPNPWVVLVMWLVCGVLSLFGALALAELGACHPRAGGLYVYLHDAFGPFVAFLFGWALFAILQTGSIAGLAMGIAQTFAAEVPISEHAQLALAGTLVVALSAANLVSVRAVADIQNLFTAAKALGIMLLILGGFLLANGSVGHFTSHPADPRGLSLVGAFGTAMISALWAYDGWVNVSFVAGEVRDPQRVLPAAMALGTGFVIVVYVATNAAYHYVLPVAAIQASSNVSKDVAAAFLGVTGAVALTALGMVSAFGSLNSSLLSAPRVYFAMARDRLFFPAVGAVHPRWQTPHVAIIVQCAWSLLLLALWKTFDALTDNVVFVFWIFYGLGAAAVLVMRWREPRRERPYSTPGYPWLPVVFIAAAVFLVVNTIVHSTVENLQALALLGIGAVIYPWFARRHA